MTLIHRAAVQLHAQDIRCTEREESLQRSRLKSKLLRLGVTMYLNVNLTPPSGGGESSAPKTPEILNSLISMTSPPLPPATGETWNQSTENPGMPGHSLSSPISPTSPNNESNPIGSSLGPSGPGPSFGSSGFSPATGIKVIHGLLNDRPSTSQSTPELKSPVSTMEATKSALIKEGLKHQIKSKLQASGVIAEELLTESKVVKEELTIEDEERRLRRRERNKVAATKCRNKKKEKTAQLQTESEAVEDQNVRLKSEIQRLASEKSKLERLLGDPAHRASCRHPSRATKNIPTGESPATVAS